MFSSPKYTLHELFQQYPLLLLAVGYVAGILGASLLPHLFLTAEKVVMAATAAVAWVLAVLAHGAGQRKRNVRMFAALLFLSCAGVGSVRYLFSLHEDEPAWPDVPQTVRGYVLTPPHETARTWSVDVLLLGGTADGRCIRARLMRKEDAAVPQPGDVLLMHGTISEVRNSGIPGTPDYASIMRRQGIEGNIFCYANHWQQTGSNVMTVETWALRLRTQMVDRYREFFEGRDLAVLAALTLGDKTFLNKDIRDVFSETGTSHVLALSGLHLGILFSIYTLLFLRIFRQRKRTFLFFSVLGFILLWLYVLLAGFPPSLCRAAITYSALHVFVTIKRKGFSLNSLSLAACILLLCSPQSLFDVGFQLSFLSVAGIVLFIPFFPRIPYFGRSAWAEWSHRILSSCYGIFAVSLCATAATLPLVAFTFHRIPIYGLLASLIVVPLAYPLLFLAFMFLLLPFARPVLAIALTAILHGMFDVLEWISSLPAASIAYYPTALGVILTYLALLATYSCMARKSPGKYAITLLLFISVVAIETHTHHTHRLHPQILFYQNFSAPALHCIESPEESYLWSTRPERADSTLDYAKRTFWTQEGIKPPRLLTASDTTTSTLILTPHVLQFHHCRIGLLRKRMTMQTAEPLRVNYLFVVRGWNRPLSEALHIFQPDTIVLDATLSDFYKKRYREEAKALRIPLHSLQRDGTLVVSLPL